MPIASPARRRLAATLACAAATALAAQPAHAQWGKIKDLGKAAAKGAVEGTAEGAAKKAVSGPEGTPARPAQVKFSDNLLEITDERLAAFLRGFDAEIAARPEADRAFRQDVAAFQSAGKQYEAQLAAYDRDREAWEKRKAAQRSCAEAIEAKHEAGFAKDRDEGTAASQKAEASMDEAREKRLEALAERMRAAQARNDRAAMMALADTVQREMAGVMAASRDAMAVTNRSTARSQAMQEELKKCPNPGAEPKRPEMPQSAGRERAQQIVDDAAAKASGLTVAQYRLMLERVETYVRLKGRTGSTQYIFTAGELEVLGRQLAELQKRPDLVQPSYWYPGKEKDS